MRDVNELRNKIKEQAKAAEEKARSATSTVDKSFYDSIVGSTSSVEAFVNSLHTVFSEGQFGETTANMKYMEIPLGSASKKDQRMYGLIITHSDDFDACDIYLHSSDPKFPDIPFDEVLENESLIRSSEYGAFTVRNAINMLASGEVFEDSGPVRTEAMSNIEKVRQGDYVKCKFNYDGYSVGYKDNDVIFNIFASKDDLAMSEKDDDHVVYTYPYLDGQYTETVPIENIRLSTKNPNVAMVSVPGGPNLATDVLLRLNNANKRKEAQAEKQAEEEIRRKKDIIDFITGDGPSKDDESELS